MDTTSWERSLARIFPKLSIEGFKTVGQATELYNCIAYAAGDTTDWWWPTGPEYWPPWATTNEKMRSLEEVFVGLEYEPCNDDSLEYGYEKVALYEINGRFQHAARQMPTGRWRSKMGRGPLIEHRSPDSLSDGVYGSPTVFMRRPTTHSSASE